MNQRPQNTQKHAQIEILLKEGVCGWEVAKFHLHLIGSKLDSSFSFH